MIVGIHTGRSNSIVREALESGLLREVADVVRIRPEAQYGHEGSRVDFLLECNGGTACYLEVKNVTAAVRNGVAVFPDAISARGARHLREMVRVVEEGHRALLVFCVQRQDVIEVRPPTTSIPNTDGNCGARWQPESKWSLIGRRCRRRKSAWLIPCRSYARDPDFTPSRLTLTFHSFTTSRVTPSPSWTHSSPRRLRLSRLRCRLDSSRRTRDAAEGRVAMRRRGATRACRMRSASRSSASIRLRACVRKR